MNQDDVTGERQNGANGPSQSPITLRFRLPLAPGVNNQYATVGRRRVLSKEAKAFRKDVKKIVDRARLSSQIDLATEARLKDALLGVYLTFYFETPLRRDLDGGLKITLDALCEALGLDDRMVVDLHLSKQIDPLHPHLDVELEIIEQWSFDRSFVYLADEQVANTPSDRTGPSQTE